MSDGTKEKMKTDVDEFGDFYFIGVDDSDIRQVGPFACNFYGRYKMSCLLYFRNLNIATGIWVYKTYSQFWYSKF